MRRLPALVTTVLLAPPLAIASAAPASAADPLTYGELQTAFAAGGAVTLGADITGTGTLGVAPGDSVTLDLAGYDLTTTGGTILLAGLAVPTGATLVIRDSVGTGTLRATSPDFGAGIGGFLTGSLDSTAGTIRIEGGTVIADSDYGAGIGGASGADGQPGSGGTVVITGGHVIASTATGAAIGSGEAGDAAGTLDIQGTADAGSATTGVATATGLAPTISAGATPSGVSYSATASGGTTLEIEFHYSVLFDAGGGAPAPTADDISYGGTVAEPAPPSRGDDTFLGWYLDGAPYDFDTPVTGPITLSAAWETADDGSGGGSGSGSDGELAETGAGVAAPLGVALGLLGLGLVILLRRRRATA